MVDTISDLECRVCRLGPEPSRPLYAPCLCAGSILFCHQDCLEMWLQHSGKDRCELCGTKFEFAPLYEPEAPTTVPLLKLVRSVFKMLYRNVLVVALRVVWSAIMWLVVVPVCTSLLYRVWTHRGSVLLPELVRNRIMGGDIWSDCVAGVIIAAIIVVSFLSLMSFVDFLRSHWEREVLGVGDEMYDELQDEDEEQEEEQAEVGERREVNSVEDDANHVGGEDEEHESPTAVNVEHAGILSAWNADLEYKNDAGSGLPVDNSSDSADLTREMDGEESNTGDAVWINHGNSDDNAAYSDYSNDEEHKDGEIDLYHDVEEDNEVEEKEEEGEMQAGDAHEQLDHERIIFPQHPAVPAAAGQEQQVDAVENELDDVREADVEIHIALDEVLGLRGPIHISLRNVVWLLAFNGAYIGLFCFVPYSIGSSVVAAMRKQLAPLVSGSPLVPQRMVDVVTELINKSHEVDRTLQLPDMAFVLIGYTVIVGFLFCLAQIAQGIQTRIPHAMTTRLAQMLNSAAAVCKVAVLLLLRIVLLPMLLGALIMAGLAKLLPYSRANWIMFAASNVMGLLSLMWVAGISYMLVITVSVLQLREILHPIFLAQYVRPKEPHPDLFVSLVRESTLTHAKRITSTLVIYVALMIVFINIPVAIATRVLPSVLPLQPNFVYIIPQLQVPVELAIAYALSLGILDGNKVASGQLLYRAVKFMCELFGLTRYLLPHPRAVGAVSRSRGAHRELAARNDDATAPPLVRPPIGWNNPDSNNELLWAYGRQRKGDIERNLAPIQVPSYCYWRCAVAAIVVWVTVIALITAILLLPVAIGRSAMSVFYVPDEYAHDSACALIGLALLWCGKWLVPRALRVAAAVPRWYASCRPPTLAFICTVLEFVLRFHVATALALGLLVHVTVSSRELGAAFRDNALLTVAQDWFLGWCMLHIGLAIAFIGFVDRLLIRVRLIQALLPGTVALRRAVLEAVGMVVSCEWDIARMRQLCMVTSPISRIVFALWCGPLLICPFLLGLHHHHSSLQLGTAKIDWPPLADYDVELLSIAGTRFGIVLSALLCLALVLINPAHRAMRKLYTQVRDECYVVGRQLRNSTKGLELMRGSSTTIDDQLASLVDS